MPVRRGEPITTIIKRVRLSGTIYQVKRGRVTIKLTRPRGNAFLSFAQSWITENAKGLSVTL